MMLRKSTNLNLPMKGPDMSIFNTILQKLGIQKPATPAASAPAVTPGQMAPSHPGPMSTPNAPVMGPGFKPNTPVSAPVPAPASTPGPAAAAAPAAMQMVDVVGKLDKLAKANPMGLDWKVSINDLMALLGMDHSADAIKELAVELGCPASELGDSYKRNVWTHKALLQKIAENGGNIPQSLIN
jgi:hypothetical protein